MINMDIVKNYLSLYIQIRDTTMNSILEIANNDYDKLKFKYNIVNDNNKLYALCILNNLDVILTIENAKLTNQKATLLVNRIKSDINFELMGYTKPIISNVIV